ncbi:MAG: DUF6457 domain-containing protein [Arachnia sp.]
MKTDDRTGWDEYVDRVCAELEIDRSLVDVEGVLDMTREIAHAAARPMAPVSAYLMGLAAGRPGAKDPAFLRRVVEDAASAAPLPKEEA